MCGKTGQKVKGRFRDKLKEHGAERGMEERGYRKQALAKVTELGCKEGVEGRGEVQKEMGAGRKARRAPR